MAGASGGLTRRAFVGGALAAAGVALYANEVSRHELEVTERTFRLERLPKSFDGFRIVQISDLHLEEFTEDFYLRRVIARVNSLGAELVLVTGDFISRGPMGVELSYAAAARCGQLLRGLTCPERYGVLGNHDAAVGSRMVTDHMEDNGLPILTNKRVRVERGGGVLLAGGGG